MRIGGFFPPRIIARAAGLSPTNLRQWSVGFGSLDAPLTFLGEYGPNGRRRYSYADAVLVTLAARLSGSDGAGLGFLTVNAAILIANVLAPIVEEMDRRYAQFGEDPIAAMISAGPIAVVQPAPWPAKGFIAEFFATRSDYRDAPRVGLASVVIDMTEAWRKAMGDVTRAADAATYEDDSE